MQYTINCGVIIMSNDFIMFWVGIVTFFAMMIIKIPIKKLNWILADYLDSDGYSRYKMYRRLNIWVIIVTFLISFLLYLFVLTVLGDSHIKLCCSFKGAGIAIALYAIVEQIVGDKFSTKTVED